jgi:hypothetical protein
MKTFSKKLETMFQKSLINTKYVILYIYETAFQLSEEFG